MHPFLFCHIKECHFQKWCLSSASRVAPSYFFLQTMHSISKPHRHTVPIHLMGIWKFGAKLWSLMATYRFLNLEKISSMSNVIKCFRQRLVIDQFEILLGKGVERSLSIPDPISDNLWQREGSKLLIYYWLCNVMQLLHNGKWGCTCTLNDS